METTQQQNKVIVRRLYEEVLNTQHFQSLGDFVADDYTGPKGDKGPAGFVASLHSVFVAFPDIKWTIEDLVAEGDQVVVRWSWKGTNTASYIGFAPTHKTVTNTAISIYALKNGKLISAFMQSDRLGFLQQIGVVSPDIFTPAKPVATASVQ